MECTASKLENLQYIPYFFLLLLFAKTTLADSNNQQIKTIGGVGLQAINSANGMTLFYNHLLVSVDIDTLFQESGILHTGIYAIYGEIRCCFLRCFTLRTYNACCIVRRFDVKARYVV